MKKKEIYLSLIVSVILLLSVGCSKKIDYIEKEKIQKAIDEILGENVYIVYDSLSLSIHPGEDIRDSVVVELEYALKVHEDDFNLDYYLFEDSDEAEIFFSEYEPRTARNEQNSSSRNRDDGYYITHADMIDMYAYYSDDMVILVYTRSGDVSTVEEFVTSLGLPIK